MMMGDLTNLNQQNLIHKILTYWLFYGPMVIVHSLNLNKKQQCLFITLYTL